MTFFDNPNEIFLRLFESCNIIKLKDLIALFQIAFTIGLGLTTVSKISNFFESLGIKSQIQNNEENESITSKIESPQSSKIATEEIISAMESEIKGSYIRESLEEKLSIFFFYSTLYSFLMIIICSFENLFDHNELGFHLIKDFAIGINIIFLVNYLYQLSVNTIRKIIVERKVHPAFNRFSSMLLTKEKKLIHFIRKELFNTFLFSILVLFFGIYCSHTIGQGYLILSSIFLLVLPFLIMIYNIKEVYKDLNQQYIN